MDRDGVTVLFLGKADHEPCAHAAEYLTLHAADTDVHLGKRGDPFPRVDSSHAFDYVLSYLSPWIVPPALLQRARRAAINFHPGPPEYPGIGCTNFAIYEGASVYGVTCHHMAIKVDTGNIVRVIRFPVYAHETVCSLTQRSYAHLATLFYDIADLLMTGSQLPVSTEQWTRRPLRRAELNALCRLTPQMSQAEVARRIRATTFPGYPVASGVVE